MDRRVEAGLVAMLALASVLPACDSGEGRSGTDAAALATPVDPAEGIDWQPCPGGDRRAAQCAILAVPVDHAVPDGETLALAAVRVPATGERHGVIGTLLVDPGGIGTTARDAAVRGARLLPDSVRERFDVVGVDRRGTGESAVDCGFDLAELLGVDPVAGRDPREVDALLDVSRRYAASCQNEVGALLGRLGTRDAARDLDSVRVALGVEQVSFLGLGHGAVLGQTYAALFPDRVRALVLDGALPLGPPGPFVARSEALGLERSLAAFGYDCNSQPDCPITPGALGAIAELVAKADAEPIPASPRDLGVGDVESALALPLRDPSRWSDLAFAVQGALLGNGDRMIALADEYLADADIDAGLAADCIDYAWPDSPRALLRAAVAARSAAPRFGLAVTNRFLPCTTWPVAADPLTPPGRLAQAPLVLTTTDDPVTDPSGLELASGLGAALLVHQGDGQTALGQDDGCVDRTVGRYLVHLVVPPVGKVCTRLARSQAQPAVGARAARSRLSSAAEPSSRSSDAVLPGSRAVGAWTAPQIATRGL